MQCGSDGKMLTQLGGYATYTIMRLCVWPGSAEIARRLFGRPHKSADPRAGVRVSHRPGEAGISLINF